MRLRPYRPKAPDDPTIKTLDGKNIVIYRVNDIDRDYAAASATKGKKGLRRPNPSSIPITSLLFRPNYLNIARIAKIPLKRYFFPGYWQTLLFAS